MCTIDRTCDICAFWSAAQWELFVKKLSYKDRMKPSCPSGYVPPALLASPRAETPSGVSQLGLLSLLFPTLQVVRGRGGGLGMHLVLCPGGLPPLPLDLGPAGSRSSERGGSASGLVCCARARSRFAGEGGVTRSQRSVLCPLRSSVVSHHSSPHTRRCGELWETSEDRCRVLYSRGSRSSDHGARVDKRARSRSGGFR